MRGAGEWHVASGRRLHLAALFQQWLSKAGIDLASRPPMLMEEDTNLLHDA